MRSKYRQKKAASQAFLLRTVKQLIEKGIKLVAGGTLTTNTIAVSSAFTKQSVESRNCSIIQVLIQTNNYHSENLYHYPANLSDFSVEMSR